MANEKRGNMIKTGNYITAVALANLLSVVTRGKFIVYDQVLNKFELVGKTIQSGMYMTQGRVGYIDSVTNLTLNQVGYYGIYVRLSMNANDPIIYTKFNLNNRTLVETPDMYENTHGYGVFEPNATGTLTNKTRDELLYSFYYDGISISNKKDFREFIPFQDVEDIKNKIVVIEADISDLENKDIELQSNIDSLTTRMIKTENNYELLWSGNATPGTMVSFLNGKIATDYSSFQLIFTSLSSYETAILGNTYRVNGNRTLHGSGGSPHLDTTGFNQVTFAASVSLYNNMVGMTYLKGEYLTHQVSSTHSGAAMNLGGIAGVR